MLCVCIRENILHGQRSARISKRFRNLSCAVSDERERERGAKHRTHICDRVEGDRESLVQSNLFSKEKLMGTLEKK